MFTSRVICELSAESAYSYEKFVEAANMKSDKLPDGRNLLYFSEGK
jgi:hypothetical protein